MAKGDKKKMQTAVDTSVNQASAATNRALDENIVPTTNNMANYYNQAAQQGMTDYNDIMNRYRDIAGSPANQNQPGLERVNYNRSPEMNEAFASYRNFINNGGYSDQNIQDMRARGVSPIRANYQNMTNEMMRQKNLQGGYSPNMGAVMTRLGAQRGQMTADAVQDVNARLAEMVNKGQQFGTSGMAGLSTSDAELAQRAALANQQAGLDIARNQLYDPRMNAVHGMAQLFGTSPGMAGTFGNQVLQGQQNWLGGTGQIGNIGNMRIGGQQAVAATPSNFEVGLGRVGQGLQMGGNVAGAFMGLPGGTKIPTRPMSGTGTGNINSGLYGMPTNRPRQNSPYF